MSAIAELSGQHQLVSISGDKTLRLWNYLDGTQLCRLELSGRGIQLAQNGQNEMAVVLFDGCYKIGIFEAFNSDENKTAVRSIAEHPCENVKWISSIMYETNDCIWYAGLDESDQLVLKRLQITRTNGTVTIKQSSVDDVLKILKENLSECKFQANEDISHLFKKSFDNMTDYQERKKRRIEKKKKTKK